MYVFDELNKLDFGVGIRKYTNGGNPSLYGHKQKTIRPTVLQLTLY